MKILLKPFFSFLIWLTAQLSKPTWGFLEFLAWVNFHVALKGLARLEESGDR